MVLTNSDPSAHHQNWKRFCLAFWLIEGLIRPAIALWLPVDLAGDEAYYWEWGQHLDWGYFSKPPGIAWLMALADKISWLDGSTSGIRLLASLLGATSSWLVVCLARSLFGSQAGIWLGLAWILTPANAALHLLLTIDAPLVFFWALSLFSAQQWLRSDGKSLPHALGLALGLLGGILSKQMMLLFFPLLLMAMLSEKSWRGLVRRPQVWMAACLGHVGLVPPIWWNARNNWITFEHTLHHFESAPPTMERRLARFMELTGAEIGLVTPLIFVGILVAGVGVMRKWRQTGREERLMWWMSFPAILLMFGLTWRQRVNPNWPAVFLIGGTMMGGGWWWRKFQNSPEEKRVNWLRRGVLVGGAMTLAGYVAIVSFSLGVVNIPGWDPSTRIRGWSRMAGEVSMAAGKYQAEGVLAGDHIWITISHRDLTSQLAFYLPGNPRVYRFSPEPDLIRSQHDLWAGPEEKLGEDALILVQGGAEFLPVEFHEYFESVELMEIIENPSQAKKWRNLSLFVGKNLRFWPVKDFANAHHQ